MQQKSSHTHQKSADGLHLHAHGDAEDGSVRLEVVGDVEAEGRDGEFAQVDTEARAGAVEVMLADSRRAVPALFVETAYDHRPPIPGEDRQVIGDGGAPEVLGSGLAEGQGTEA